MRELIDVYGRLHDEWVAVEVQYRDAVPGEEQLKSQAERRKKFDIFLDMFPNDLIVPIDGKYLKDKIKQLRQNRQKRNKWLSENNRSDEVEELDKDDFILKEETKVSKEDEKGVPMTLKIMAPQVGSIFPRTVPFQVNDFIRKSN